MKKKAARISILALSFVLAGSSVPVSALAAEQIYFSDIAKHWSRQTVEKWAEEGVVSGYPDGTFQPDNLISRAEFGVWVSHILGYDTSDAPTAFADVKGHWAENIIDSLVEHGVILPSEYGENYEPDKEITRMEMLKMMVRAIEKDGEVESAQKETTYADNAAFHDMDCGWINVASAYSVVAGYPDGTLNPYANATRAEGATMLVKLQKVSEELPTEEPKQEEVREPSSSGGGSSKVRPATIAFTLAASTYVTDKEPVAATISGATSVEWKLLKDGVQVDMNTYATASLTQSGGEITFMEPGDYELVCAAKNRCDAETTASKKISVYPNAEIRLNLPNTTHTDRTVPFELTVEKIGDTDIAWTITDSNGNEVALADAIVGEMNGNSGLLQLKEAGEYTITAKTKDSHGKEFKTAQIIKVYPVVYLDIDGQSICHIDEKEDITLKTKNLGDLDVEWTVTSNGSAVDLADIGTGTLDNTGGEVQITKPGNYVFTTVVTDETGRTFSQTQDIKALPLISFNTTVESDIKKNVPTSITSDVKNIGDKTISWSLKKDGIAVDMNDYIDGTLDNNGGNDIIFKDKGNYTLIATVTDETGRVFADSTDFAVTLMQPNTPEGIAYPTRKIKDQKLYVDFDTNIDNPYQLDIHYEWKDMPQDQYFALGTHTVQVRALNEDGAVSEWSPVTFTLTNRPPSRPKIEGKPTGGDNNYISPSQMVNLTATGSKDPDGDTIHYVWENYNGTGQTYSNGKQLVKVKAVDAFGAESSQAAILFFVADETGGGMTLKESTSFIHEPGVEGATITKWTYNVPKVSGHNGKDYGLVEGYNQNTKEWERLDKVTTSNGVTMSGNLTPGVYTEMRFTYYTNHDCMYNKSNITYTVEFYFPDDEYSNITLTMPDTAYTGETVEAQATAENMTDTNLTWTVEKDGQTIPLSDVSVDTPNNSGGEFKFTQAGAYTVTITGKDNSDNTITDSQMIHVYDKTNLALTLPERAAVGEKVQASLKAENLGMNSVTWAVEKDNQDIPLDSVAVGTPNNVGGTFQFNEPGIYTVKTVVTDKGGGATIEYKQITIYPATELEIAMKDKANPLDMVSATLTTENLDDKDVEWTVEKDGEPMDISDVTTETPDKTGGKFKFTLPGEYVIKVTVTDSEGNKTSASHTITVYESAKLQMTIPDNGKTGETIPLTIFMKNGTLSTVDFDTTTDIGEDYTITDKGNGNYELKFTSPGTYSITASTTDTDGNTISTTEMIKIYSAVAPKIILDMPEYTHTDKILSYTNTDKNFYGYTVEWTVHGENDEVLDWDTYIDGKFDGASGQCRFKKSGTYTLHAKVTGPDGDVWTYDDFDSCTVYKAYYFDVVLLPEEIWTENYSFTFGTRGNASAVSDQMNWTIGIDGDTIVLGNQDEFNALLEKHGSGEYTVTCSYTDDSGREFSNSAKLKVNVGSPNSYLDIAVSKKTVSVNEDVVVTTELHNADGLEVEWNIIKDGAAVGYDGFMTGKLGDNGGTINFTEVGRYTICATITDSNGDSFTTYKVIAVDGTQTYSLLANKNDLLDEDTISINGLMKGKVFLREEKIESEELPKTDIQSVDEEEIITELGTAETPEDASQEEPVTEPIQNNPMENMEQTAEGTEEKNLSFYPAAETEQSITEEPSADSMDTEEEELTDSEGLSEDAACANFAQVAED